MLKLKSADLFYGTSRYPMEGFEAPDVEFAPIEGELLNILCADIATRTGCLSAENIKDRISHNMAIDEQRIPIEGRDHIVIPRSVCLLGNGFSLVWRD